MVVEEDLLTIEDTVIVVEVVEIEEAGGVLVVVHLDRDHHQVVQAVPVVVAEDGVTPLPEGEEEDDRDPGVTVARDLHPQGVVVVHLEHVTVIIVMMDVEVITVTIAIDLVALHQVMDTLTTTTVMDVVHPMVLTDHPPHMVHLVVETPTMMEDMVVVVVMVHLVEDLEDMMGMVHPLITNMEEEEVAEESVAMKVLRVYHSLLGMFLLILLPKTYKWLLDGLGKYAMCTFLVISIHSNPKDLPL